MEGLPADQSLQRELESDFQNFGESPPGHASYADLPLADRFRTRKGYYREHFASSGASSGPG